MRSRDRRSPTVNIECCARVTHMRSSDICAHFLGFTSSNLFFAGFAEAIYLDAIEKKVVESSTTSRSLPGKSSLELNTQSGLINDEFRISLIFISPRGSRNGNVSLGIYAMAQQWTSTCYRVRFIAGRKQKSISLRHFHFASLSGAALCFAILFFGRTFLKRKFDSGDVIWIMKVNFSPPRLFHHLRFQSINRYGADLHTNLAHFCVFHFFFGLMEQTTKEFYNRFAAPIRSASLRLKRHVIGGEGGRAPDEEVMKIYACNKSKKFFLCLIVSKSGEHARRTKQPSQQAAELAI